MTVTDLFTRRVERLDKAQHETNQRLGRVEDTLGRVATVLEVHSRHFERIEDVLIAMSAGIDRVGERVDRLGERVDRLGERVDRFGERLDRLTTAFARGRSRDLLRFDDHERRLRSVESKGARKASAEKPRR
jgi:hypothetical protein